MLDELEGLRAHLRVGIDQEPLQVLARIGPAPERSPRRGQA